MAFGQHSALCGFAQVAVGCFRRRNAAAVPPRSPHQLQIQNLADRLMSGLAAQMARGGGGTGPKAEQAVVASASNAEAE